VYKDGNKYMFWTIVGAILFVAYIDVILSTFIILLTKKWFWVVLIIWILLSSLG